MILNYKYRLYVNKHTRELSQLVTTSNHVWNHVVALYRRHYKMYGRNPSCAAMQRHIAKMAKRNPYWAKMGSQSLQEICQRVDQSYSMFFKKTGRGRPDFHKTDGGGSFVLKGSVGYALDGNEITVNKLGHKYRFKLTRPYGAVRNVRIRRDNTGYLWLVITTDVQTEQRDRLGNASIGLDFGLKHFLTTSDGDTIDSLESHRKSLQHLRRLSRDFSRKAKGSNGRRKSARRLAKAHERVADQRADFQWKLAHELCSRNAVIAIEDLNLDGMRRRVGKLRKGEANVKGGKKTKTGRKRWGRKVSDLGYGEFVRKLEHVAGKYGTAVIKIGRFEASSQTCHVCGYRNAGTKDLAVREWTCPSCGTHHDRDVNAAVNILNMACGKGVSRDRSDSKTPVASATDAVVSIVEESHVLQPWEYVKTAIRSISRTQRRSCTG